MEKLFFNIERVVFEKYINELSNDAFKVLMKMMYLAKTSENDISIRSNRLLRRLIGMNVTFADSIWNELITAELVIKKERQNRTIYILNSKKIRSDNTQFEGPGLRNLRVTIFNTEQAEVLDHTVLADEIIDKKIKQIFNNLDESLSKSLMTTIQLLKKYHTDRDKKFTLSNLGAFLIGLVQYNNKILRKVCDKYNTNKEIAGLRGFKYVLRMAQGMNIEKKDSKDEVDDAITIKEAEKQKEDGERKFALKVATGIADSSIIFAKLIEQKQYEKLKHIWQKGTEILKEKGQEEKIYNNYDWLKLEAKNGI